MGCVSPEAQRPPEGDVFRALADPSRRQLLDRLNEQNGQTLHALCEGLGISRQAVSKHLALLVRANLVTTLRRGRETLHFLNAEPIEAIGRRWISRYHAGRVSALANLKSALEESAMSRPEFVYTTYIKTTPEKLWQGLTEPAFTRSYWGTELLTDWKPGSTMIWVYAGVTVEDPEQRVLEADPPRRLVYTWQSITPEFARAVGFTDAHQRTLDAEPRSKVTFELEPLDDVFTKLTVVHDGFPEGSEVLKSISAGWPMVLSGLKTFLETGEPTVK